VRLPLTEVEALIGRPLPDSVYVNTSYWVNGAEARLRWRAKRWHPRLPVKARAAAFRRIVGEA
jgi:hypothetical protein